MSTVDQTSRERSAVAGGAAQGRGDFTLRLHPEGMSAISRWLRSVATTPPVSINIRHPILKGSQQQLERATKHLKDHMPFILLKKQALES
jgi:hypothetical protein